MKKIVAAFLATALATVSLAGTAQAQARHSPQAAPAKQTQTIRHETQQQKQHQQEQHQQEMQQTSKKPVTKQASPSRYPAPPKHWGKKSNQEWQRHVDRCRAKYRSYNPKTDRFTPRHGQTVICRL